MKITPITVLFFVVGCLAILRIIRNFKREEIRIRSTILWISIWLVIGIGSIFPSGMDYFMRLAQMENREFFIVLTAVFVLFALIFELNSKYEKVLKDNAKIIQEITILNYLLNRSQQENSPAQGMDNNKLEPKPEP